MLCCVMCLVLLLVVVWYHYVCYLLMFVMCFSNAEALFAPPASGAQRRGAVFLCYGSSLVVTLCMCFMLCLCYCLLYLKLWVYVSVNLCWLVLLMCFVSLLVCFPTPRRSSRGLRSHPDEKKSAQGAVIKFTETVNATYLGKPLGT